MFANNPITLQELRDICHEVNLISRDELQRVSQNVLERCETYIQQDDGHFQTPDVKVSLREKNSIMNVVL
mgnify:CR=1 FL=1